MGVPTSKHNFRLQEPDAITTKSFQIIEEELKGRVFNPAEFPIIRRVIHATADFDFAHLLRFHPRAVSAGVEALRAGSTVVTDTRMVEAGINQALLHSLGGRTLCLIAETPMAARTQMVTRSAAAMRRAVEVTAGGKGGVFVIGTSPTALLELVRLVREEQVLPALIVGVPVGFVLAAESKEELMTLEEVPWVVTQGRKGGSAVAVAIINALLYMAAEGFAP